MQDERHYGWPRDYYGYTWSTQREVVDHDRDKHIEWFEKLPKNTKLCGKPKISHIVYSNGYNNLLLKPAYNALYTHTNLPVDIITNILTFYDTECKDYPDWFRRGSESKVEKCDAEKRMHERWANTEHVCNQYTDYKCGWCKHFETQGYSRTYGTDICLKCRADRLNIVNKIAQPRSYITYFTAHNSGAHTCSVFILSIYSSLKNLIQTFFK